VIFKQRRSIQLFGFVFTAASLSNFALAFDLGHVHSKTSDLILGGFSVPAMIGFFVLAIMAIRSWRQSVTIADGTIIVRSLFRSRRVNTKDIEEYGMYWNVPRNALLAGVKTNSGKVVKFPFWSKSWIRDDPRNNRMLDMVKKIENVSRVDAPAGDGNNKSYIYY
jgi:hypothetical protein